MSLTKTSLSKTSRLVGWLAVVCLICSTLVFAQGTGGRIIGRVADASGAVLANVKVTLTNEATGVSRETQTNESGDYSFPGCSGRDLLDDLRSAGFQDKRRKGNHG